MARILIVEDNPTNLELLRYLLEARGHTTTCASDGREGLLRARTSPPDLILSDLRMPEMDGYELLLEVRNDPALREVIVIAVTAHSMPEDAVRVRQAGFDGYLTKPIEPSDFVATVESFLAAPRRRPW